MTIHPARFHDSAPVCRQSRRGLTLVEILVATVLMLLLMGIVVWVFAGVGDEIRNSRSTLIMMTNLRSAAAQLEEDLASVTVTMRPPRSVAANEGYFEYIEGPIGTYDTTLNRVLVASDFTFDSSTVPATADSTVGDNDDILMFTARSRGAPYVGRFGGSVIESHEAEIAWFVRGTTLYRRVLLIVPKSALASGTAPAGFYADYDVSVHRDASGNLVANSLADLARRECRFMHDRSAYPHRIAPITLNGLPSGGSRQVLWLPTLNESSSPGWRAGEGFPSPYTAVTYSGTDPNGRVDLWNTPFPYSEIQQQTGEFTNLPGNVRGAEDVILTNVIGFDVKAWDPDAPIVFNSTGTVALKPGDPDYLSRLGTTPFGLGAYVDLGYAPAANTAFSNRPTLRSGLRLVSPGGPPLPYNTYDTWSTHYEEGRRGTNGFDDNGDGVVDSPDEWETAPPYAAPLRGLQVKIRVFDPVAMQVREVTLVQDFLPR